jgi:ferredoxin
MTAGETTVLVAVDAARCRGHQMCVLGCPDVFVEGDNDDGTVEVVAARQPADRLDELRRTESSCPETAVSIIV